MVKSMKAWTRIAERPVGREPAIYLIKPQQEPLDNPWAWEVEEWDSVEDAFKAVFDFCDNKEYRDKFRIISESSKEE